MTTKDELESEIGQIDEQLAEAEKLKAYKATLEALLQKSSKAMDEYPAKKYADLLKRWQDQDRGLKDLLAKLQCSIPAWEELLRQTMTPLFTELARWKNALRLPPEPKEPGPDHGLYALRDRQQLLLLHVQARYDRAVLVLAAWEKPAPTLEKILNENDKLAASIRKSLGLPDAPALLFDMFFKLLPLHYLIAPPDERSTRVNAKEFVIRCAGEQAWKDLKALIGPLPMLIDPEDYLDFILNGPFKEYHAAKTGLADAAASLQTSQDEIKRAEKVLDETRKSLEKNARAALLEAGASRETVKQAA